MTKVKVFLLSGCVEVICTVEQIHSHSWQISRPLVMMKVPTQIQTPRGISIQTAIHFAPLLAGAIFNTTVFNQEDVVAGPFEATKEAENAYLQQTTGIALAQ